MRSCKGLTVVIAGPDEVRILDGRARVTLYSGHVHFGSVYNVAKVSLLEGGPSIGWTARKGPKVEKSIKTRGKNA